MRAYVGAVLALMLAACGLEGRRPMPTDTQIVAQWPLTDTATPLDLQRYFAAELLIERECGQVCSVDGNDVGGGVFNVFLYSNDVDATVAVLRRLRDAGRIPEDMRVGVADYTNADRTDWVYSPVYPDGLASFDPFGRTEVGE